MPIVNHLAALNFGFRKSAGLFLLLFCYFCCFVREGPVSCAENRACTSISASSNRVHTTGWRDREIFGNMFYELRITIHVIQIGC